MENGILHRMGQGAYFRSINKCMKLKIDRSKKSKLTLYDLSSAFFILGLGISLSVFVFVVELILRTRLLRLKYNKNIIVRPLSLLI